MTQQERFIELFGISWYNQLKDFLHSEEFNTIGQKLLQRRKEVEVCPAQADIFKAFRKTPFDEVKVVLIGLHPYKLESSATGLAFGVDLNVTDRLTRSIKNIHKSIESDLGVLNVDFDYTLEGLAEQGVLLLNLGLTADSKDVDKHVKLWKPFMDVVLSKLKKFGYMYIDMSKDSNPPNGVFTFANAHLWMLEKEEINWNIKNKE